MSVHLLAGRETRVLGLEEVRTLLSVEDAIEVQRAAFLALSRGRAVAAPNSWLRLPGERRAWLKLLAGYDATGHGLGVKVLARFPENPPGTNLGSLMLLFDDANGFPLAVMDGVYITAARTGAGAALATEALAPDAEKVGLIGTGVVAWYSLQSMMHSCPRLGSVTVFSRSEERRREVVARIARELGLEASAVATVDKAVAGVDVIVTATNSPDPILLPHHLSPGVHVNAMGIKTEIAPETTAACVVIGDGREETIGDGKFSVALAAGTVTEDDLGPDLGEVLDGNVPAAGERPTMFDSSGVALQDVTCARYVWERAEEHGVGTLVEIVAGDVLS
jgi:ornithine cyclodeaminase/alanine dehydrogenase-like protein (mu-crystallin family)